MLYLLTDLMMDEDELVSADRGWQSQLPSENLYKIVHRLCLFSIVLCKNTEPDANC